MEQILNINKHKKNKRSKQNKGDSAVTILAYTIVIVFSLICLYPVLLTIMVSFSDEYMVQIHGFKLIPEKFSFDTYRYIFYNAADKIGD